MKKSLTAILFGLLAIGSAGHQATAQPQTTTFAGRPTAPANVTYEVWYKVLKTGKVFLYKRTPNEAAAIRALHYLNEDPRVFAWKNTVYPSK